MLETKKPQHEFNPFNISQPNSSKSPSIRIKKCNSRDLFENISSSIDLNVEQQEKFICFECAQQKLSENCKECQGTGYLKADHPLVQLMNDIFNEKFIPPSTQPKKKELISTKTSSNSNISDSISSSEKNSNSIAKNSTKLLESKQKETQKGSILDFLLTPLPTIIKEESTMDDKCKKCNICQYEFDSVKYMCEECENYNVCETCYQTKRINHGHELKKIQSVTSQHTGKNDQSSTEHLKLEKNHINENQESEFPHSDIDKLSLKSDESMELMFNRLKTKDEKNENNFNGSGLDFFKLYEVEQEHKKKELCNNCQQHIQDCYWICETCQNQKECFQLCKDCYDHEMYEHPKEHNLGLNFFHLDENFFAEGSEFSDHIKEEHAFNNEKREDTEVEEKEKENIQPLSTISMRPNSKLTSSTAEPEMLNIGVIGHRDIFTGFHKEAENEHYKNEIISPIPRSMKLPDLFKGRKDHNFANEDAQIIVELMSSSINTTPKKSIKMEKNSLEPEKENINNQSRVEFDENMIINLGLSEEYNEQNKEEKKTREQLYKSENRDRSINQVNKIDKFLNLFPNMTLQDINPETSFLGHSEQEDFYFNNYVCDICQVTPIKNIKYHCLECEDYDLCEDCYHKNRVEHWHDHFRKDDGRLKLKKMWQNKQKIIKKAVNDLNRSLSPSRRSFMYMK